MNKEIWLVGNAPKNFNAEEYNQRREIDVEFFKAKIQIADLKEEINYVLSSDRVQKVIFVQVESDLSHLDSILINTAERLTIRVTQFEDFDFEKIESSSWAAFGNDHQIDEEPTKDEVNRPAHYTDGKIEVIDFIEDKKLGFHLGNTVKYVARAGKKDPAKEIQDLEKARWYLDRRIQKLKEGEEKHAN